MTKLKVGSCTAINDNSIVKTWDGEGYPPVGTKCRVLNKGISIEWEECEINFIGDHIVVYSSKSWQEQSVNKESLNLEFKPLKSDHEILVDEALSFLYLEEYGTNSNSIIDAVYILIKAGYRLTK